MAILSEEEVENYKGLRVADLNEHNFKSCFNRRRSVLKLQKIEEELCSDGEGLPYFLAMQYHIGKKGFRELIEEYDLTMKGIIFIFNEYNIPRLTPSETASRRWEDVEDRERQSNAMKLHYHDPNSRERLSIKMKEHFGKFGYGTKPENFVWIDPLEQWTTLLSSTFPHKYRTPISQEEVKRIITLYDEVAPNSENHEDLVGRISNMTGIIYEHVDNFLGRYLDMALEGFEPPTPRLRA